MPVEDLDMTNDGGSPGAVPDPGPSPGPGSMPVDLSPGATTVAFNPIIPLLRVPIPAGNNGDEDGDNEADVSKGKWLLAFKNDSAWRQSLRMCHSRVSEQCEAGARMGCSITAANACRIPWWKQALIFLKVAQAPEAGWREACEDRAMTACLADSQQACAKFARDTCDPVFADAQIAEADVPLDSRFSDPRPRRKRLTRRMIIQQQNEQQQPQDNGGRLGEGDKADGDDEDTRGSELSGAGSSKSTHYRGRDLLANESMNDEGFWDGSSWSEDFDARRTWESSSRARQAPPIDRWEGGLISPKFKTKSVEEREKPQT